MNPIMKTSIRNLIVTSLALIAIIGSMSCTQLPILSSKARLVTPPLPSDMPKAPFNVEIKLAGEKKWEPLFVYKADSLSKKPHAFGGAEGFVKFAFTGEVEMRVSIPHKVHKAVLRPSLRDPIGTKVNDKTVSFKMDRPRYLALEINQLPKSAGEIPHYMLYILADKPEENHPCPNDTDVKCLSAGHHTIADFDPGDKAILYLAEGVHTVDKGIAPLHTGKTLYISDGAILRSKIIGDKASDAKLLGRGIIDGSTTPRVPGDWRSEGEQGFIFLRRGERITIDGTGYLQLSLLEHRTLRDKEPYHPQS